MTDYAITDLDEKEAVNGEELIEVVDLRESDEEDQNKYMTIDTFLGSILTFENEILVYEGDILYS
jgi:hypothetical protein